MNPAKSNDNIIELMEKLIFRIKYVHLPFAGRDLLLSKCGPSVPVVQRRRRKLGQTGERRERTWNKVRILEREREKPKTVSFTVLPVLDWAGS